MCQMPARCEVHAKDGIPRLKQCKEDALISLRPRIWLHIGEANPEQRASPLNGEIFCDIYMLTPAIITLPRITFGIFIGEDRALGLQDGLRDDVLRGNQLNFMLLTMQLILHTRIKVRIAILQALREVISQMGNALIIAAAVMGISVVDTQGPIKS